MINYNNSKIYKIISHSNPELIYYGSTTQTLSKRMVEHRSNYKTINKRNISSNKILCFEDAIIVLVELYPCNSKEELIKKESEYILNNDCVNKIKIMGGDKKKRSKIYYNNTIEDKRNYYEKNKDKIKERMKVYRELNKELINLKKKEYYKKIKIKIKN